MGLQILSKVVQVVLVEQLSPLTFITTTQDCYDLS